MFEFEGPRDPELRQLGEIWSAVNQLHTELESIRNLESRQVELLDSIAKGVGVLVGLASVSFFLAIVLLWD